MTNTIGLTIDGMQIDAQWSPFAFNENEPVLSDHADKAGVFDGSFRTAVDYQIVGLGFCHFRVPIVRQQGINESTLNGKAAVGVNPTVAIARGCSFFQPNDLMLESG